MVVDFDLVFKQSGDKIDMKKSSKIQAISGFTVMTWMKSSDPTVDMALFHSTSLRIIMNETISIEKGTVR